MLYLTLTQNDLIKTVHFESYSRTKVSDYLNCFSETNNVTLKSPALWYTFFGLVVPDTVKEIKISLILIVLTILLNFFDTK